MWRRRREIVQLGVVTHPFGVPTEPGPPCLSGCLFPDEGKQILVGILQLAAGLLSQPLHAAGTYARSRILYAIATQARWNGLNT